MDGRRARYNARGRPIRSSGESGRLTWARLTFAARPFNRFQDSRARSQDAGALGNCRCRRRRRCCCCCRRRAGSALNHSAPAQVGRPARGLECAAPCAPDNQNKLDPTGRGIPRIARIQFGFGRPPAELPPAPAPTSSRRLENLGALQRGGCVLEATEIGAQPMGSRQIKQRAGATPAQFAPHRMHFGRLPLARRRHAGLICSSAAKGDDWHARAPHICTLFIG